MQATSHVITKQQHDPHHCHCFKIRKFDDNIKKQLLNDGFYIPMLEFYHGQKHSFVKKIDEYTQTHIKIMPDGTVEAENEYPSTYPIEHLDSTYCYSAHEELEKILNYYHIPYVKRYDVPVTCIERNIVKANNPAHWSTLASLLLIIVELITVAILAIKRR